LIQPSMERRIGDGDRRQRRPKLAIGVDTRGFDQMGGATEQFDFGRIAPDRGKRREVFNRAQERRRGSLGEDRENLWSGLEGARFGRRLFGSLFGFGWQLGVHPIDDATFECGRAIPLADENGGDVRTGELVRI
jgi:hypothetical protein